MDNLASAGRFAEARELLPEVETLCRSAGSRLDEIRLRWVAGRIAAGLGDRTGARQAFDGARREFAARGMAYDAALVSLELAVLLIENGQTAEVRELAEEIAEIFRARDVHRETLAALAVFQAAVDPRRRHRRSGPGPRRLPHPRPPGPGAALRAGALTL